MRLRSPSILGLSLDDRGARCAEVVVQGSRRLVRRLGRIAFAPDALPSDPAACGRAIRAYLDAHEFRARRAVVGVPARGRISQDRELPPSDRAAALDILRLHGERLASGGGGELIVDVAGAVPANLATRVLLVGILRPQLDRLNAIAEAADLELLAVTASSLALHEALGAAGRGEPLLALAEGASEVVGVNESGSARLLKHLPAATADAAGSMAPLGSELRRTITLSNLVAGGKPLAVWNAVGLSREQLAALGERSGATLSADEPAAAAGRVGADVSPAALNGDAAAAGSMQAFASAIALGIAGTGGRTLPVDFLDPKLAPVAARRFGRRAAWMAVVAAVAVVALGSLYQSIYAAEAQAAQLAAQVVRIDPDVKRAKAEIARVSYGRSYFESRPPILEGLREVALAFNFSEPIWATSFALRDSRRGLVQGKTTDQRLALALRDRLAASPRMREVKLEDLRESGGGGGGGGNRAGEQSFSISFLYAGTD